MHPLVKEALKTRTKWRLHKDIGVTWNAVYMWTRGIWNPNLENQKKLKALLKKQ